MKWEYEVGSFAPELNSLEGLLKYLNDWGGEGWEAVRIDDLPVGCGIVGAMVIFKRQIREDEP